MGHGNGTPGIKAPPNASSHQMTLFSRYLGANIYKGTIFVLAAFLSMFLFLDFLEEVEEIGRGGYGLKELGIYLLLGLPNQVYEFAPIAALIGALWALSQSAANSEFTVFRVSGLRPQTAIMAMLKIGLPMVLVTGIFSEVIAPIAQNTRENLRAGAIGTGVSGQLRSGLWLRDTPSATSGAARTMRFVNVGKVLPNQKLERIEIYDFDANQQLTQTLQADRGLYLGFDDRHRWQLLGVQQTTFHADGTVSLTRINEMPIQSSLSPETVGALVTNPDRMAARELYQYVNYLKENKQQYDRYDVAFWKRIIYPFAIWVMLLLALPTAYLQARAGAVGARVFAGILVGVSFHLINNLFSHLGVLTALPAVAMAAVPSLLALMVASLALYWVQRR
jgi:lipopolysaccharide export system permease protein